MKLLKTGSSRWVFLTNKYAFKFPSFHSYRNFLWGILSNLQEVEFSRCISLKHKLCPITFNLPGGFLVVMPRVRVLTENELPKKYLEEFCTEKGCKVPAELKNDSFGYLKGKLVAIDYG